VLTTLWDVPRGLCAPTLCTAFDHLVITTSPGWVGRLFRAVGPTLLLRGVENARAEATRLAAGGVRHVELRCRRAAETEGIAESLRTVGIAVRIVTDETLSCPRRTGTPAVSAPIPPPADPSAATPTLELVSHDAQTEQAVFRFGSATYAVQIPWGNSTSLEIILNVGSLKHRDRLDLAVVPQRLRFASTAGLRAKLPPAEIASALALILPAVQALAEPQQVAVVPAPSPALGMTAIDKEAALARLRNPNLLQSLVADLEALGTGLTTEVASWVVLAAVSRLAVEPLWLTLASADPAERFPALDVLARITPPEALLQLSRLTDSALFHGEADDLRHKLLVLDDLTALASSAATALRMLHARGRLTTTTVERDLVRGGMRTRIVTADGPLAVVTACAGTIPEALRNQLMTLPIDADAAPCSWQRNLRRRLAPTAPGEPILRRLHQLQRLLAPAPVLIPETEPLELPALITRDRTLHAACIGLMVASALLHQHQRLRCDGAVVATASDISVASRLVLAVVKSRASGLSTGAQQLLRTMKAAGRTHFHMEDCAELLPSWTRWSFRATLTELVRLDYLLASRTGQGKRRTYSLLANRSSAQLGGLAELGGTNPPSSTREVANG
jgi:hypothetical protein